MKKYSTSQSAFFYSRVVVALTLCSVGVLLAAASFAAPKPKPAALTFGHPIISGIGGGGFGEGLGGGPSDPNHLFTLVAGSLSSDTSWVVQSLHVRKTFQWRVA